ncbi:hypothetical protein [Algivirga pacifica]|uniref:Auto-transporter adhesin head GIN domain-containing protein n=1 Tax=Algivirga pacifica TaxID=1162670 RepID=A0ABP9D8B6_9BACT
MKTSNKILMAAFGSIVAFILIAGTSMRIQMNDTDRLQLVKNRLSIAPFKYIKVNSPNFTLSMSTGKEHAFLLDSDQKIEDSKHVLNYYISNDTLYFKDQTAEQEKIPLYHFTLTTPDSVHVIDAKNTRVNLSNLKSDYLQVTMEKGELSAYHNTKIGTCTLDLRDVVNHSSFSSNTQIEEATVNLNNSEFHFYNKKKLKSLKGTIYNESKLTLNDPEILSIDKDQKSSVKVH